MPRNVRCGKEGSCLTNAMHEIGNRRRATASSSCCSVCRIAIFSISARARCGGITKSAAVVGKFAIGLYLGKAGVTSGFGAAGSVVALLVWMFYSAQIFLLGAEFTWLYAHSHGSRAADSPVTSASPVRSRAESTHSMGR